MPTETAARSAPSQGETHVTPRATRRHVVHVITRFIRGGADENTLLTCNGLAERGHKITLIYGRDHHPDMIARLEGVTPVLLPSLVREVSPATDIKCLREMRAMLHALAPDIVHTHESKAGIIGRLAAPRATAHVVHGVHILPFVNVSAAKRVLYLALEKIAARRTDAYIDVSTGMRDECLAHGLGTPAKHTVVPSGMDAAAFRNATPATDIRQEADERAGARATIALMVAAFEPRKRQAQLLHAVAPVLSDRPELILALAGDGPQRPGIMALASKLGIDAQVMFLGHRNDAPAVIAAADICLMASEREGLPRVIVQYALAGKPIVTTAIPGIAQVVTDGESGLITPLDDLDMLAASVRMLADDKELRRSMGTAHAKLDLSPWDASTMVERILEVYSKLSPLGNTHEIPIEHQTGYLRKW